MRCRARHWGIVLMLVAVGCGHQQAGDGMAARLVEYVPKTLPSDLQHPIPPNEPPRIDAACTDFGAHCTPSVVVVQREFSNAGYGAYPGYVTVITRIGVMPEPHLLAGARVATRDAPRHRIKIRGETAALRTTSSGCDGTLAADVCNFTLISWTPEHGIRVDVTGYYVTSDETLVVARALRPRPIYLDPNVTVPSVIGTAPQPRGHRGAGESVTIVLGRTGSDVCLGTLPGSCYWRGRFSGIVRVLALPSDDSDYLIGFAPPDVRALRVEYEHRTFTLPTIGHAADRGVVAFALYYPDGGVPTRIRAIHDDGHVTKLCNQQVACRNIDG